MVAYQEQVKNGWDRTFLLWVNLKLPFIFLFPFQSLAVLWMTWKAVIACK
jgi:hypothetical protein